MDSSSGTSSGSSLLLPNSGSEEELQAVMDQRKKKRMLSNRESARRSRMRKQQHLDELMGQVAQLRKENGQVVTALNVTTQHYLCVEADNSVLRTQMVELGTRLQSLNEMIQYMNLGSCTEPWNMVFMNHHFQHQHQHQHQHQQQQQIQLQQPIIASADMFQYC